MLLHVSNSPQSTPRPSEMSTVASHESTYTQPVSRAHVMKVEDNEENLRQLYNKAYDAKKFLAEKAWESVRFHSVLLSSLISVTIGALVLTNTSEVFLTSLNGLARALLTLSLVILPFTMLRLVQRGVTNFERECRRMYEQVSVLIKLEEKFGFFKDRTEKEQFPEETGYFPPRYYQKWTSSADFIKSVMSQKDSLYGHMGPIFDIFKVSSYALMFAVVGATLWHLISYFLRAREQNSHRFFPKAMSEA